jgi:hypothetical protein
MLLALFIALAALRVLFIERYRIDSDEPQHLHVVWGWTHHLVQYRDVFDNHTPLFHLLCAPVFALVGERADALIYMRFAMVPLFIFSLWCVYRLGRIIHSPDAGLWAAVFTAVSPAFCFTFTEYRADDLWTALWLCSLLVLLGGEFHWKRGLAAGLLFGATLATSLKTVALLACLGVAALVGLGFCGQLRTAARAPKSYLLLGALIAGAVVVPGALAWWFASQGALHDAIYGIFGYNSVSGLGRLRTGRDVAVGVIEMVVVVAALIPLSAWMARRFIEPERCLRFHLIFLGSGFYGSLIYCLWPLLDAEHLIPFYPLIIVGLMPAILDLVRRGAAPRFRTRPWAILTATVFINMAAEASFIRTDKVASSIRQYRDLLQLSNPTDYVMDIKGETIFRRRPVQYLFEGVGIARAQQGLMPDDIPERMKETKTCITVSHNYRFVSPRALAFMDDNYIPVCRLRVLGHAMTPAAQPQTYTFQVVIPETFAFVSKNRKITGTIDGQPCPGFATLAAGAHTFVADRPLTGEAYFVWKQAIERGFLPQKESERRHPDGLSKPKKGSS